MDIHSCGQIGDVHGGEPSVDTHSKKAMSHTLLSLGAVEKLSGAFVYPKIAKKKTEYICLECKDDLILCQGKIRVHHFRHKGNCLCQLYGTPTETQIHKDAKLVLKTLLDNKAPMQLITECCSCHKQKEFAIPEKTETSEVILEYKFEYNGTKIADVAFVDKANIVCIFEICHTHKTDRDNRPEPWFEIDAKSLIKAANNDGTIQINCIRGEKCEDCVERDERNKPVYLHVSYQKKQMIKDLGGVWNAGLCLWYVANSIYMKHEDYINKSIGSRVSDSSLLERQKEKEKEKKERSLALERSVLLKRSRPVCWYCDGSGEVGSHCDPCPCC